jgi:hypothetical protein
MYTASGRPTSWEPAGPSFGLESSIVAILNQCRNRRQKDARPSGISLSPAAGRRGRDGDFFPPARLPVRDPGAAAAKISPGIFPPPPPPPPPGPDNPSADMSFWRPAGLPRARGGLFRRRPTPGSFLELLFPPFCSGVFSRRFIRRPDRGPAAGDGTGPGPAGTAGPPRAGPPFRQGGRPPAPGPSDARPSAACRAAAGGLQAGLKSLNY